jgi:hypothetical protein
MDLQSLGHIGWLGLCEFWLQIIAVAAHQRDRQIIDAQAAPVAAALVGCWSP